jgi:hypothetical protein
MRQNQIEFLLNYIELLEKNILAFTKFNKDNRKKIEKKLRNLSYLATEKNLDIQKIIKELNYLKNSEKEEKSINLSEDNDDDINILSQNLFHKGLASNTINFFNKNRSKINEDANIKENNNINITSSEKSNKKNQLNKKRGKK